MNALGAFLTVLHSDQWNRDFAKAHFADELFGCQVGEVILAYFLDGYDG